MQSLNYHKRFSAIEALWLVLADFSSTIKLGSKVPIKDDLIKAFETLNLKAIAHA